MSNKKSFDWIGLIVLIGFYSLIPFFTRNEPDHILFFILTFLFFMFFLPLFALIRGWGEVSATCYFCGHKKVTCMFQNGMGCIYHACKKHEKTAYHSGTMNFTILRK